MPLWHPQWWGILQTRTYLERKIQVSLGAQGIQRAKSFIMPKQENSTTHPFGLPWLVCGILMEEAFLNSS